MRLGSILLVTLACFFFHGCASVQVGEKFTSVSLPDPGMSLVYVYRPISPPFLLSPEIRIDQTEVSDLPSSSYFSLNLEPGEYRIESDWHGASSVSDGEIVNEFEQGNTYYVRVANTMSIDRIFILAGAGYAVSSFSGDIALVNEEKALSELPKCKVILLPQ